MASRKPTPFDPPIRHVVWDWNGTLTDDVDVFVASLNRMLNRRRLQPVDRHAYREAFDFPVRHYYLRLGFDLEHEDWDALSTEFHDGFSGMPSPGLRPETRELLNRLQTADIPMSVLSALEQSRLDRALETEGLRTYFQYVHGADNLDGHSKLDRGRELSDRLGLQPATICLVGDTTHDYQVATALGWECLLVATGHHSRPRLEAVADRVVDSLNEAGVLLLNGADESFPVLTERITNQGENP